MTHCDLMAVDQTRRSIDEGDLYLVRMATTKFAHTLTRPSVSDLVGCLHIVEGLTHLVLIFPQAEKLGGGLLEVGREMIHHVEETLRLLPIFEYPSFPRSVPPAGAYAPSWSYQ